jgi:hypothetical protein
VANRGWTIFGGVLLAAMVAQIGVQKFRHAPGRMMPEFAMKTLDGKPFSNKEIMGRVAVFYLSGEG